jgi:hypothetical protein
VVIGLGLSTAIPEISMSTDVITEQEWQKELRANAEHRRGGDWHALGDVGYARNSWFEIPRAGDANQLNLLCFRSGAQATAPEERRV